ncbi:MAG: UDP-N-acetylglucosamine 1-carboxyvinyltransferase [Pseudomonadota bacterium]
MDKIRISGGASLNGDIVVAGAKNAALKLMVASLLTEKPLVLENVPYLADVDALEHVLDELGVETARDRDGAMTLSAATIRSTTASYDLVRKMRASVLVFGPLLARCGKARVSLPGGCAIGTRPVDLHIKGFEQMGAMIDLDDGYMVGVAPDGLKGATIRFPYVSVGATEHLMMAATLADGETVLENAAREPEIADLAQCLNAMGAQVSGAGSTTIRVQGVDRLDGTRHRVLPDRIETGTYAMAAALTDGELNLIGGQGGDLDAVVQTLTACGADIAVSNRGMTVKRANGELKAGDITTAPHPGFPTDLQAQFMALMATADGTSHIAETIFENRFMHVPELARMGADITVNGGTAVVRGVEQLTGAPVMATDLRASVSLVLAGLAADGETTINRVYHLDRGYECLVEKLSACGAQIDRVAA